MSNTVNQSHAIDQSACGDLCSKAFDLKRIIINSKDYFLPEGIYRVADLKRLAEIPESSKLVRILGCNLIYLKNEECIGLDGNEHFETSAGCGKAS